MLSVVLTTNKKDDGPKKGKGADIARWEAELRQSLASKKTKAGGAGLSKEEHALMQAQLAKEAVVRERVGALRAQLLRGLAFIRSVVRSGGVSVKVYVRAMAERLLEGAMSPGCARLVGEGDEGPFETFVGLAACCSERLEGLRRWVGVAVLRALEVGCVPEGQAAEALDCASFYFFLSWSRGLVDGRVALVLRVLYRLRTLSEQAPFDAATFSFAFFLLGCVARKGGVGVNKGGEQDGDEALEQVALVLDVIKFHRSDCTSVSARSSRSLTPHIVSDAAFPRKIALEHVLHVVRTQPRLSKDASSLLIDLGEAIQANATRDEVGVLIAGTLLQETHVRNSCLQALQVRRRPHCL